MSAAAYGRGPALMSANGPRLCSMCGRPITIERRKHGRDTSPSLWFVHTETDRIPCETSDIRVLRNHQLARVGRVKTPPL